MQLNTVTIRPVNSIHISKKREKLPDIFERAILERFSFLQLFGHAYSHIIDAPVYFLRRQFLRVLKQRLKLRVTVSVLVGG